MVDQLAAAWLPAYGHPLVQAPNLTALAGEGVVFESAYCPSPLCAPSRSALLTGRLSSEIEVYDNAGELRASQPTIAHLLRRAGYHTSLVGKMHFVGPDQLHGFEERLTTDLYPADLDWTPDWRLPPSRHVPWYHTMESVVTPGLCPASMQMDFDDEVAFRAVRKLYDLARYRPDGPFLLVVSFAHPHDPWEIRPRYWELYDEEAIDLPAVPAIPLADADPHSRRLREMCGTDDAQLSDEQIRRARHGYYAALSYVDERIGDVLAALHEAGLADDTVVVFTADHGEMLGERGLWYKMAFFEASARVPLIVRMPELGGPARIAQPVSLLDLAPTILELAAHPDDPDATADMQGVSLVGLLRGEGARPGDVLGEYLAEGVHSPAVMIRRGRYKYIACEDDPEQLYDLGEDPAELVNLAADPSHEELRRRLRDEVARIWDLAALKRDVLESQRRRRLVIEALGRGRRAPWDFQPHVDASMQYVRPRADLYDLQRRARLNVRAQRP